MSKATFKNIVIMTIPGTITPVTLMQSLKELVREVKGADVSGILVDVTALSKNEDRLKKIGEATGEPARATIDPALYRQKVKKVAFVESSGKFHGRDTNAAPVSKGPIIKRGAPAKHYFTGSAEAIDWLLE